MNTEPNTKHAARAAQVERQVEKKAYTHDIDSQKKANKQGWCVKETKAIIGKAPRLGIHTRQCPRSGQAEKDTTLRGNVADQTNVYKMCYYSRCVTPPPKVWQGHSGTF